MRVCAFVCVFVVVIVVVVVVVDFLLLHWFSFVCLCVLRFLRVLCLDLCVSVFVHVHDVWRKDPNQNVRAHRPHPADSTRTRGRQAWLYVLQYCFRGC